MGALVIVADIGAAAAISGIMVMLTTESYLLSAPLAESTIEEMPAVSRMSPATLATIVAEVPEWLM